VDQYAVKFTMHLPKDENLWEKRAKQPLFGFLLLISSLKLLESYKFQRSSECNFGANSGHVVSWPNLFAFDLKRWQKYQAGLDR
jgi:hypothetical protein